MLLIFGKTPWKYIFNKSSSHLYFFFKSKSSERSIELTQPERKKEKNILVVMWDNDQSVSIFIVGGPEGEEEEWD